MKEKDVSDLKTTIEKKCKDRKIANLTMEEFYEKYVNKHHFIE